MTQPLNDIDKEQRITGITKVSQKQQKVLRKHVIQRAQLQVAQAQEWVDFFNSVGEPKQAAYWREVLRRRRILLDQSTLGT